MTWSEQAAILVGRKARVAHFDARVPHLQTPKLIEQAAEQANIRKNFYRSFNPCMLACLMFGNVVPYLPTLQMWEKRPIIIPSLLDDNLWGLYQEFRPKWVFIFEQDYPVSFLTNLQAIVFLINCTAQPELHSINSNSRSVAAVAAALLKEENPTHPINLEITL